MKFLLDAVCNCEEQQCLVHLSLRILSAASPNVPQGQIPSYKRYLHIKTFIRNIFYIKICTFKCIAKTINVLCYKLVLQIYETCLLSLTPTNQSVARLNGVI